MQTCIPRPIKFTTNEITYIDEEIKSLILKGAIILVNHTPGQIISNMFTRPRKSGGLQTIINLKGLNKYLEKIRLKMKHSMASLPLLKQVMYTTSHDLKDAYFSLPKCIPVQKISPVYLER